MQTYKLADYLGLAEFLQNQPVATIAVPINDHGDLHAAALHFWNSEEPLKFYFVTGRNTEKAQLLKTRKQIPCAVVVGTQKGTSFTVQMRGDLSEGDSNDLESYYQKHSKFDDINDPKNMCLVFTPKWARFTDYSKDYARFMLEV